MATDFTNNTIIISGGLKPQKADTPLDVRSRIETLEEVEKIPNPNIGMIFYVKSNKTYYTVDSLKSKIIGSITIPNSIIDTYHELLEGLIDKEELSNTLDENFSWNEVV